MAFTKERCWLIYGLVDPRTLLIHYVGMSSKGMFRPNQHRPHKASSKSDNDLTRSWTAELSDAKLAFEIAVLQDSTAETLKTDECWWIAFGRACGWPLTNLSGGGEGGAKHPSTRAKLRDINIARFHNNEAERDRVRQRTLQQMQSPEQRLVRAIACYRRQGLTEDEVQGAIQRKITERVAKATKAERKLAERAEAEQKRKALELSDAEIQQKRAEQAAKVSKAEQKQERRQKLQAARSARERLRQLLQWMRLPEQRLVRAIAYYSRQGLTEDEVQHVIQRKFTERTANVAKAERKRKVLSDTEIQQKRAEQAAKAARKLERRRIKQRENARAKRTPLRPRVFTEKQRAALRTGVIDRTAISAGHRVFFADAESRAEFAEKISKTWTPERRAAMSAHAKARQSSPEWKVKLAERRKI